MILIFFLNFKICDIDVFEDSAEFNIDILKVEMMVSLGSNKTELMFENKEYLLDAINLDYHGVASIRRRQTNRRLGLKIKLQRKLMRSFVEIILPSGFLVVVSWVSRKLSLINDKCCYAQCCYAHYVMLCI